MRTPSSKHFAVSSASTNSIRSLMSWNGICLSETGNSSLSPDQIERLAPDRRLVVYKAISTGGGLLVGKLVTRELVIQVLKIVGVRLTTQQAAKYVPIAGQAVSALLTYGALRYVCDQHIRQCQAVARTLALPAPPPPKAEMVQP